VTPGTAGSSAVKLGQVFNFGGGARKEEVSLEGHLSPVRAVACGGEQRGLFTGSSDGMILAWDYVERGEGGGRRKRRAEEDVDDWGEDE
jgi:hypothetical protein